MAGGLVGAVALSTAGIVVVRQRSAPERTVRAYFDALAARDADTARSLLTPGAELRIPPAVTGLAPGARSFLLHGDALRNSGYTPPRNVSLRTLRRSDNAVTVEATYEAGGDRLTTTMTTARDGTAPR
jgi:hypothetical protein